MFEYHLILNIMSKLFLVQGVINPNAKSWPKEGYVMHYIIYTPLEKGQKL